MFTGPLSIHGFTPRCVSALHVALRIAEFIGRFGAEQFARKGNFFNRRRLYRKELTSA